MYSHLNNIRPAQMWANGPAPGQLYNFPSTIAVRRCCKCQNSATEITKGSSVVGVKFRGGVMLAADNLIMTDNNCRYHQNIERLYALNDRIILGTSGDYADFQNLKLEIAKRDIMKSWHPSESVWNPRAIYSCITEMLYKHRSRWCPLRVEMVVGGWQDNKPFLGHIDMRGCAYEDDVVVSNAIGKRLVLPLLREHIDRNNGDPLEQSQAEAVVKKCMEVLYYIHPQAMNAYSMAVCNQDDATFSTSMRVDENWTIAKFAE